MSGNGFHSTPGGFTVLHEAPTPTPASQWAALEAQRDGQGAAGVSQHGAVSCPPTSPSAWLGTEQHLGCVCLLLHSQRRGGNARLLLGLFLCVNPLGFCGIQSNSTLRGSRGSNWAGGISTVLCVPQGLLLSDLILPPTPFVLFC